MCRTALFPYICNFAFNMTLVPVKVLSIKEILHVCPRRNHYDHLQTAVSAPAYVDAFIATREVALGAFLHVTKVQLRDCAHVAI